MRNNIVNIRTPDIICLSETHLKGDDSLYVTGFKYYWLDRTNGIVPKKRGSEGIGILINLNMLNDFTVDLVFAYRDNVLGLELTCKFTGMKIVLCTVSIYHQIVLNSVKVTKKSFTALTIEMYQHSQVENIIYMWRFQWENGK